MRTWWRLMLALALPLMLWGKGEYTSKYLYTEANAADPGGIRLKLGPGWPKPDLVVAVARKTQGVYRGTLQADGRILFAHLPVDLYDLLVVSGKDFYDGIQLVAKNDPAKVAAEKEAVQKEVLLVEGFFEGKSIHRLELDEDRAVVLLQQHRIGVALAESGAALAGTIHSIDLIWFYRPAKGWQLLRRRQLYREELPFKEPLTHHRAPGLSKIRVLKEVNEAGPVPFPVLEGTKP